MMSEDNIVTSLPDRPIPNNVVEKLHERDDVEEALPIRGVYLTPDRLAVYQFLAHFVDGPVLAVSYWPAEQWQVLDRFPDLRDPYTAAHDVLDRATPTPWGKEQLTFHLHPSDRPGDRPYREGSGDS